VGYTGHAHDATGLTYIKARFYDPSQHRFLTPDPIHFVDDNPFTFNRYAYGNNNPYRYVDPDGQFAQLLAEPVVILTAATVAAGGCMVTRCLEGPVTAAGNAVTAVVDAQINFAKGMLNESSGSESTSNPSPDGPQSKYADITKPGSTPNRKTDVTKREFESGLEESGYSGSPSKDGAVTRYQKPGGSTEYTTRDTSKSTGGPTAEAKVDGEVKVKIRFKDDLGQ